MIRTAGKALRFCGSLSCAGNARTAMSVSNARDLASTDASVLIRVSVGDAIVRTVEIIFDFVSDKRLHVTLPRCTCIAIASGWPRIVQGQLRYVSRRGRAR